MNLSSLAVIVIARNEVRTIEQCLTACLESVERATRAGLLSRSEVVLVDSASTDGTREVAARLPVRILAIPAHWPLSAGAGRFVGLMHTRSDLVLFVDGDYVLEPEWLSLGLRSLTDPSVAGVCGVDRESLQGRSGISRYLQSLLDRGVPHGDVAETDAIAVGLYRRNWIARVGGVQPFLKGAEDRDLAIRVRALGGRLLRTKAVMGVHHWAPGEDLRLAEYLRSVAHWSFGEGQAARNASGEETIQRVYFRRYFHLRHLLQLEMGLLLAAWLGTALVGILTAQPLVSIASLAGGGAVLAGMARQRRQALRDILGQLHVIPYATVRLGSFALGFLRPPRPSSAYPRDLL